MKEIRSERLLLRQWRDSDLASYAALNADPDVRRWFRGTLSREESDREAAFLRAKIETDGFGLWAAEIPGAEPFIGFIGVQKVPFDAPFTPAVEAGWRLARRFWGHGYATEGARAAMAHGFQQFGFDEIVAMVVPGNLASRRVMDKLGMRRASKDDFDHPRFPEDHPFRRHMLYRAVRLFA